MAFELFKTLAYLNSKFIKVKQSFHQVEITCPTLCNWALRANYVHLDPNYHVFMLILAIMSSC